MGKGRLFGIPVSCPSLGWQASGAFALICIGYTCLMRWLSMIVGPFVLGCLACGPVNETIRPSADAATVASSTGLAAPFRKDSPFNIVIPESPVLDPNSDAMVAYLARKSVAYAGLYEFGIPITEANAQTPRVAVTCTMDPAWGTCPFAAGVHLPDEAKANKGLDGVLVILETSERKSYEFWQFGNRYS